MSKDAQMSQDTLRKHVQKFLVEEPTSANLIGPIVEDLLAGRLTDEFLQWYIGYYEGAEDAVREPKAFDPTLEAIGTALKFLEVVEGHRAACQGKSGE